MEYNVHQIFISGNVTPRVWGVFFTKELPGTGLTTQLYNLWSDSTQYYYGTQMQRLRLILQTR